ncbi:hypothetical protein D3C77_582670 [compost metagenome]
MRVFAGIHLGQKQLQHRFVGRLDALEKLPESRADILSRRNMCQVAEVQVLFGAHEALGKKYVDVMAVT